MRATNSLPMRDETSSSKYRFEAEDLSNNQKTYQLRILQNHATQRIFSLQSFGKRYFVFPVPLPLIPIFFYDDYMLRMFLSHKSGNRA